MPLADDLLRKELRVGDPRSVKEVAEALRAKYAPEAERIDAEGKGRPLSHDAIAPAGRVGHDGDTAGARLSERAVANVGADLDRLLGDPATREWIPELSGWKSKLLREVKEGAEAARFAQDAAQRERALLSVRRLGEYARVARHVGRANAIVMPPYRRLGRSLDVAAASVRIFIGEALDEAGLAENGIILSVPVADARQRRSALVATLQTLVGTRTEGRDAAAAWAYGELLKLLTQSAPELRVYVREAPLTQALDDLLAEVARQDPDALRTVASTAPITISHLRQLLDLRGVFAAGDSQALWAFFDALELFVDAFETDRGGARFVELAVPVPLGAEELGDADSAGRRLLRDLVGFRAKFARLVDGWALEWRTLPPAPPAAGTGTGSSLSGVAAQPNGEQRRREATFALDRAVYLVDRGIDFFLQGSAKEHPWGAEEQRAACYLYLARKLVNENGDASATDAGRELDGASRTFVNAIYGSPDVSEGTNGIFQGVSKVEDAANKAWKRLAESMSPHSI